MKALLLALIFSSIANAAEVLWLKLEPKFAYKDLSVICSNDDFSRPTRYFGAEVDGGKVVRAVFQANFMAGMSDPIALDADEIKSVNLLRDGAGNWWVKSMTLSKRLLNWFFFRAGFDACRPPQELLSVEPATGSYQFPMDEITTAQFSDSNLLKFSGRRKDGGFYEAQLGFIQRQYDTRP